MLSTFAAFLVSPLGAAWCLGLLALLVVRLARKREGLQGSRVGFFTIAPGVAGWLGVAALAWLWAWSTPLLSDALRAHLEAQAGPRTVNEIEAAAVIVVLGGSTRGPYGAERPYPDLTGSADRLWHAARLYHAGKAQRLLLTGGQVASGGGSEAEAMQRFLLDMGVPGSAMLLESQSHNTATNARHAAQMLRAIQVDTVILVTSALHMPRGRLWLEHEGLTVVPAPTDFEVVPMPLSWQRVLPDAEALSGSARAFKELLARAVQP